MIATLEALLASKYGKVALEILIVAGLVFGAYKWAERRGRDAQKSDDQQQQSTAIEKSRQEAQAAKDKVVDQAQASAVAAQQREQAAEDRFKALASTLQAIAGRQKAGSAHVSGLQDSELHSDVVSQLKLRSPADATSCYTAKEERAIDDAVTQYPLCKDQARTLGDQLAASQQQTAAAGDKAAALQQALDGRVAYEKVLEADYKQLFEQHPPRYRAARCLWVWKCGKRKVNFDLGSKHQ
jgi:hypothetical protein